MITRLGKTNVHDLPKPISRWLRHGHHPNRDRVPMNRFGWVQRTVIEAAFGVASDGMHFIVESACKGRLEILAIRKERPQGSGTTVY